MSKMKTLLFLAISSAAVILSCMTEQRAGEVIEFPTIEFGISPDNDTTLFGPKGTRVFIGSGTFQHTDGSPVTEPVKIELKEFYDKSDIVLSNLSTVSGGRLLETAGMIHISATANGKELRINPDKRIVVHFPNKANDSRKMKLFYADQSATDSSVTNWVVDSVNLVKSTLKLGAFGWAFPADDDSTSYDFIPRNYVDTGYYWNPIDFYISSYQFTPQTIKEVETTMNKCDIPNLETWNDYGVQCDMKISTDGYIQNPKITTNISKEAKKGLIDFLKNLPQLEPGKDKHGNIIERRGLLFIQGGKVIPLYGTDEEYVKSFDQKYSKFEESPIRNMSDAEVNYYIFSVSKLGWINCDIFIETEETTDLIVQFPADPATKFKMVFSDINGALQANVVDGKYVFSKVPVGRQVTIVGIKNNNGQFMTAFSETTISDKPLDGFTFTETTLAELRTKLEKLNRPSI